jgi:hypothetical protein
MTLEGATKRLLLAVLSAAALVLAACGSTEEPVVEPAAPEPIPEEQTADEGAVEETAAKPEDDAEPAVEGATEPAATEEQPPEAGELTAYVVAYHWGFAIFDEDGAELDQLRVRPGTSVELVAVNDHASAAIAQPRRPRARRAGAPGATCCRGWH